MKKTLLALLCCSTILGSCTKTTDTTPTCGPVTTSAPATEVADLQAYITSKGITAQADSRGFFYTISQAGSDVHPNACSSVKANYSLHLTNGTEIETNYGVPFSLSGVIAGWQEGIPLVGEGGSIVLYLPPSLGYGNHAQSNIPANSILIFHVDLLKVN
jgi:FKBP-type peptidyl-prolyl cis-trans isomerase FkpA